MSLIPPLSVQKLQKALHVKAKGSPQQRFHALYDKVYRKDVLAFAYDCCRANNGAATGQREWTVRGSSRSSLTVWNDGWVN